MHNLRYTLLIIAACSANFSYCSMSTSSKITKEPAGSMSSATRSTPSFSVPDRTRLAHALTVCALTTGGLAVPNCLNSISTITDSASGTTGTVAPSVTKQDDRPAWQTQKFHNGRYSRNERG